MAITIGQQLGSYEIIALLGKGAMGEVYRAKDAKLKREVAIKILPDEFSDDTDRIARFQREAEALAALNHQNIGAIYDLQEANNTRFLILELVEGETLADIIATRGALPLDDALNIAKQICEALEAAHEKGVVHRDLKPANVKLTTDGKIKVLDFGLAKAIENTTARPTVSNSPTLLSVSMPGLIIGTVAYMSPEQARGRAADQRSDVFSFGCVLYEMLTGKQAFQGEEVSDVIASVLKVDPDRTLLPPNMPAVLQRLLYRCLEKDPRRRWYAIGDVRVEIESSLARPQELKLEPARELARQPQWKRAIGFVVSLIVAVAIASVVVWNLRPLQTAAPARFSFALSEGQTFSTNRHLITISPDGQNIVYVANQQLYLRAMGEMEAHPIQGTQQNPNTPFFSPDGRWLAFYAGNEQKLKKIALTGGAAGTIGDVGNPYGASWGPNDQIYVGQGTKGIVRVSAKGGKAETVVEMKPGEAADGPQVIQEGKGLLFTVASGVNGRWDDGQIVVQSLKSGERKVVHTGGSDARYVATGHLVYALGSTLLAIAFDAKTLEVSGGPARIVEGVMRSANGATAAANFSTSTDGSMVYVPSSTPSGMGGWSLVLVDKTGMRTPLNIEPAAYSQPRFSPDGKQLAVFSDDDKRIFVYDLNGAKPRRRLTFGGRDTRPLWTPDGQRIAFTSDRDGDPSLYWQRADGTGAAERLSKAQPGVNPAAESWAPDGKTLFFSARVGGVVGSVGTFAGGSGGGVSEGLMMLTVGDPKPKPLIPAPAANTSLSRDGRWIAYTSAESGISEIYVQPFPLSGSKYQVTTTGGVSPVWSPDGKQLFYLTADSRQIVAVDIQTDPSFAPGKSTPLPIRGIVNPGPRPYDISRDGKYFVVMFTKVQADTGKLSVEQINVTLNWFEELRQRVPVP